MTWTEPDERTANLLVAYYALYQLVHVFVNIRGLGILISGGTLDFPAPPPAGGWSPDVVHIGIVIGFADLFGAVLALIFAYGYLRRAPWRLWVGTVALTISLYAHAIFAYWPLASGAWVGTNALVYVFIHVASLPILWLTAIVTRWALSGRLVEAGGRG